ncbi:olfactory receptor 6N1-like [Dendropsophus ebraccatus]|uniref:olfactory receptor 6N1-like n=1 Tax=Dendropsophus ebraccatus TaxID=150705 RepID=UPI003831CDFB
MGNPVAPTLANIFLAYKESEKAEELSHRLRKRGYPQQLISESLQRASSVNRLQLLTTTKQHQDEHLRGHIAERPTVTFRRTQNIKDLLVHGRLDKQNPQKEGSWLTSREMAQGNTTVVKEFILLAFADLDQIQIVIFLFFLLTYITCILGNFAIIIVIKLEPSLHKPMYLFISAFAVLEIMFVSVTVPKLLAILIAHNNTISFISCFTQMCIFSSLGVTECHLLMMMAFDRHVAINNPLRYPTIMTHRACIELAIFPWIFGFTSVTIQVILTARLEYCGPNIIDHYFCDFAQLQNLACSDTSICTMVLRLAVIVDIIIPFFIIIGFYVRIIMTVIKIKSKDGKQKAFSTCTSHLIVTSLFYGTAMIVYAKSKDSYYDKYLTFMFTAFTPTINPFIYTFRNREVKKIFLNLLNRAAL